MPPDNEGSSVPARIDNGQSTRVRRACDGCRIRKVKCDRTQPCSQCNQHAIACVTTPEPEKRKNIVRGRLVAQARGDLLVEAQKTPPSTHADHHSSREFLAVSSPGNVSLSAAPRYIADFFRELMPQFEKFVYPFSPALSPDDILEAINKMNHSFEDAALVYAASSTTIFLTDSFGNVHGEAATTMHDLILCSLEAQRQADLQLDPRGRINGERCVTNKRIITNIFLEISMMAFKLLERSFSHLREAITLIQLKVTHDRNLSVEQDQHHSAFQRLYWEAYIHERFLTITSGFPSVLPPLKSGIPVLDPSMPLHIHVGFNRLIHLFLILDDTFLAQWDGREEGFANITNHWIENKQIQLDQDEIDAAEDENELHRCGHPGLTEHQRADLFITRLWLRTLLWQIALSKGFLRSVTGRNSHEALSLQFPALRLSTQLKSIVSRLDSIASIGTQGSGIIQKLFEVTSTIADVLALSPVNFLDDGTSVNLSSHIDDFLFIVKFFFNFERIYDRQRAYLLEKVDILRQSHSSSGFLDLPSPGSYLAQVATPLE
ncbi:hypothetical protein OPT61_g3713 [Boeremia exigua]|uniref:Uncharacterized protein n=1 Tax=Boeremia exigua TaxID=749465 RepID=A0ACC2IGX4_9PLEO|nr:hypothetical protein OPT61_g3713 [Boeremia exigua]